jgi:hypothetical protein
MNWAWWDGKMTLHHYREEHGLDDNPPIEISACPETSESGVDAESEATEVKHGH